MTGWRHTDGVGEDDECWGGGLADDGSLVCGCATPTPDPASPCGFLNDYMRSRLLGPCGLPSDGYGHRHDDIFGEHRDSQGCHPHVPTLCRCGHRIEED